jgi:hypothetical protein
MNINLNTSFENLNRIVEPVRFRKHEKFMGEKFVKSSNRRNNASVNDSGAYNLSQTAMTNG